MEAHSDFNFPQLQSCGSGGCGGSACHLQIQDCFSVLFFRCIKQTYIYCFKINMKPKLKY